MKLLSASGGPAQKYEPNKPHSKEVLQSESKRGLVLNLDVLGKKWQMAHLSARSKIGPNIYLPLQSCNKKRQQIGLSVKKIFLSERSTRRFLIFRLNFEWQSISMMFEGVASIFWSRGTCQSVGFSNKMSPILHYQKRIQMQLAFTPFNIN